MERKRYNRFERCFMRWQTDWLEPKLEVNLAYKRDLERKLGAKVSDCEPMDVYSLLHENDGEFGSKFGVSLADVLAELISGLGDTRLDLCVKRMLASRMFAYSPDPEDFLKLFSMKGCASGLIPCLDNKKSIADMFSFHLEDYMEWLQRFANEVGSDSVGLNACEWLPKQIVQMHAEELCNNVLKEYFDED